MSSPGLSSSDLARQKLEDSLRLRCQEAHEQYRVATVRYRKLLEKKPPGPRPNDNGALASARQAESDARAEYTRAPKIFTELSVRGAIPAEGATASATGGQQ